MSQCAGVTRLPQTLLGALCHPATCRGLQGLGPGQLTSQRSRPSARHQTAARKRPHMEAEERGAWVCLHAAETTPQHRLPAWFGILISPIDVEDAVLPAVATASLGSPVGSGHTGAFMFQKPPLLITPVLFSPKSTRVPPMSLVFLFTLVYFCCSVFLAHVDEN